MDRFDGLIRKVPVGNSDKAALVDINAWMSYFAYVVGYFVSFELTLMCSSYHRTDFMGDMACVATQLRSVNA